MFIHTYAQVLSSSIGPGTRVYQFAVIMEGARIGEDCNINAHTLIEGGVELGDRVTVKSGVYIWNGTIIESDVFIGPGVVFTNDPFPRSKQYPSHWRGVHVKRHASVGAGAVLLPGVVVGEHAMVGAGAVVTNHVLPREVVVGNPAKRYGFVCLCDRVLRDAVCDSCGFEPGTASNPTAL